MDQKCTLQLQLKANTKQALPAHKKLSLKNNDTAENETVSVNHPPKVMDQSVTNHKQKNLLYTYKDGAFSHDIYNEF